MVKMMDEPVTFIIVDDDEKNIATLSRLVPKLAPGYPLVVSQDGADGWEVITRVGSRMVILCGTNVPKINHLQLLKLVKSSEKLSNYYFIIVTASTDREENIKLFQMGADDLLKKPFSFDDIVATLKTAIRIRLNDNIVLEQNKSNELRKVLEEDKESMKKILVKVQELSISRAQEKLKTAVDSVAWITRHFGDVDEDEIRHITNAASLCLIGRIFLKDDMK
jgi:response regulator RpfG family c-di-GMP phosphodiesterase